MHVPSLIEKKRDGGELKDSEIRELIHGYSEGAIPDYQMSAFAMAVCLRGMSSEETVSLTRAMMESGEVFHFPASAPKVVDKHSTGGIGDKVSLVLAPLLACDELWVPMISGRGLGITGGTLDKLESIPGFDINLDAQSAINQLRSIGVVMIGQTREICPADKKLYALRDVTGTVPSQPLIVASIMSKKLAESLDALVLDVKYGSGAFMKSREEAEALGLAMKEVGEGMGVRTEIAMNPMDEPLGRAVGNALEVVEAVETLKGNGPVQLRELVLDLAEKVSLVDREELAVWLDDGSAYRKFQQLIEAQHGDVDAVEELGQFHRAPSIVEVVAPQEGIVGAVDAEQVGRASLLLGAGRSHSDDVIDPAVGFDEIVKVGDQVRVGEVLARVHAKNKDEAATGADAFLSAITIE